MTFCFGLKNKGVIFHNIQSFSTKNDQMLVFNFRELHEKKFEFPFRMFLSGSSQSGKTTFAGKILSADLFKQRITSIIYFHPDYLDQAPVNWHNQLKVHVSYKTGLPTLNELCVVEEGSCIVLDDLYEECVSSKAIDYLFRVLSGKKNLSVIIMSQRYFAQGRYGMNIRNNVNYTVLMRNADARINRKIATLLNVEKQLQKISFEEKQYPYVLIDASPSALGSGYRVYEDIFSEHQIVYSDSGMRGYVISEKEFERFFTKLNKNTAQVKNADEAEKYREPRPDQSSNRESPPKPESTETSAERRRAVLERLKRRRIERKTRQALSRS